MTLSIQANDIILFQGDSITDADRDRDDVNGLGDGYVRMVIDQLSTRYPELNLRFFNRGISGNRIPDLLGRWQEDCLDLKPTLVSIMIGINDVWRRYDSNDPTTTEDFEAGYRELLTKTREQTNARLVLCEAFLLPYPEDRVTWREDIDPKLAVTRRLAKEFDAILVPYDTMFEKALNRHPAEFWAADGVHPTQQGHALMAGEWLIALGA